MKDEKAPRRARGPVQGVIVIVVLTVLGAAAGFALGSRSADRFTAEASVLVAPLTGNPYSPNGNGDDLVNLETEAQLVSSDTVAAKVVTELGGLTTREALDGLSVTVPANTQILVVDQTAGSRADARARAQSFAKSYLAFRTERANQVVSAQAGRIQKQINRQTRDLDALVRKQSAELVVVRRAVLQEQVNGATTQIAQLRTALADLQTGEVDPGQVITPAHVTSRSPRTTMALFLVGGALVGFALGILVLALLTRARTLREVAHAEEAPARPAPEVGYDDRAGATTASRSASPRVAPDVHDEESVAPVGRRLDG
ncbi:MAG: hypothetical protein ABI776_03180 [Nocardioidaceae bacterium]